MPRYQYVQIGFEPDTLNELDALVSDSEINDSRSELVRQAVQEYLNEW